MSDDLRNPPSSNRGGREGGPGAGAPDGPVEMDRLLPPPAFTPGGRRQIVHRRPQDSSVESLVSDLGLPEDAFISPDAPIQSREDDFPEDAFISPDAPFRPRPDPSVSTPLQLEGLTATQMEEMEVEITGIGESDAPYYGSGGAHLHERLEVEAAARVLEEIAAFLREGGPGSLLRQEGRSGFESTLRGFVAGYYSLGSEE